MQKKYGVINQLRKTRMLELFRTYLVVGGMPRAVERYKETNNFSIVYNIQRTIMKDYELDIIKFAESNKKQKVRSCFLSIPKQLAKENRKFQYSMVEKGFSSLNTRREPHWISSRKNWTAQRCNIWECCRTDAYSKRLSPSFLQAITEYGNRFCNSFWRFCVPDRGQIQWAYPLKISHITAFKREIQSKKKAIRLSTKNIGEENGILSHPVYMAFLL